MNKNHGEAWWGIFLGIILILGGVLRLTSDEDYFWRGGMLPPWLGWITIPAGIVSLILSFRLFRYSKEPVPEKYTDHEIAQAKAEMDALYLKEHGEPPDKNGREPGQSKPESNKVHDA